MGRHPGGREGERVAGVDLEVVDVAVVDRDREAGSTQHQLVGPGDRGDDLLAPDDAALHPRLDLAVVEPHDPFVLHPHRAADPGEDADQVGTFVGGGHQVEEGDDPGVGRERRLERGRLSDVPPGDLVVAMRAQLPVAVIGGAEDRGEAGGGVEARQAQPVDRAVLADERGGVAVAQQGVVLDRQRLMRVVHVWNVQPRPTIGCMSSPVDAASVQALLLGGGATVATAESLTGGLLGGRFTSVPGSSEVYLGGVVTYSTDLKVSLLGVPIERCRRAGGGVGRVRRGDGIRRPAADRVDVRPEYDGRGRPGLAGGQARRHRVRRAGRAERGPECRAPPDRESGDDPGADRRGCAVRPERTVVH